MKNRFIVLLMLVLILLPTSSYSEYGDVVLNKHTEVMAKVGLKPVIFPHWFHRIRFKCKACHEDIFIMGKGANDITMAAIIKGDFCGKCHNGKIAWDPLFCDRCHAYTPEKKDSVAKGK